tara:strand:- start:2944 stop:3837 length:894 start_codon:yes stop_codon:yes gene_type:complete
MKKKKVIISGINGFLARNFANELVSSNNFEVIGFGRNSDKHKLLKKEITIISYEEVAPYIQNHDIDIILHSATNYGRSNDSIESILSTNLILPVQLYSIARRNNVQYFVNIDTILPKKYSEYALSKKQFVEWAKHLHSSNKFSSNTDLENDFKFINIEFEHFYGPGAPSSNFISWIINQLRENTQDIKLTECKQKREFIFITDAVSALKTVFLNLEKLETYESITIGSGYPIPLKDIIFKAKSIFNSNSSFNFGAVPLNSNQRNLNFHNHTRIRELGWRSEISMNAGLTKIKNQINE